MGGGRACPGRESARARRCPESPGLCRAVEQADLLAILGDPAALAEVQSWLESFVGGGG